MSHAKFAVIDLETDPFLAGRYPAAFAAGFYDGNSMQIYWDDKIPAEGSNWYGRRVCREVVNRCIKFGGKVYIHNGGKFDLHHLLDYIPRRYMQVLSIGARIVELKTDGVRFLDSYSLIPKPLKSWGKKDISYALLERDKRERHKPEIIDYLKEDLRQLYGMLEEFFERFGSNLTLASTAFGVMRKKFKVDLPRTTERHDSKFRPWYFAGRVQFFGLGKFVGDYRILDVNSAFPHAMCSKHWFAPGFSQIKKIPKVNPERCFYEVECNPGGAIPHREENGSVSFPHVHGRYFVCGWELLAGVSCGAVKNLRIIRGYRPSGSRDLSAFVNHFYDEKRAAKLRGDRATEYFSKIMLNAGYGKFALDPRQFRDVAIRSFRCCPCGKNHVGADACLAGWEISWEDETRGLTFYQKKTHDEHQSEDSKKPMRFYNVCTAASITSYVRAALFASMRSCRRVLYCDTDSIIGLGVSRLKIGDELGAWKEEMRCDVVWIGGKKLYVAHNAAFPFSKQRVSFRHFKVAGHGWALPEHFKTAAKGVRMHIRDLIAVCLGEAREMTFAAPSYSVFSAPRFVTREINRADRQKKACVIPRLMA